MTGSDPAVCHPTREGSPDGRSDARAVDFFVSYVDADRAWAEWIAWHLEDVGYQTRIRAWDLVPGSAYVHELHRATQQAARTVAVLSSAYLQSAAAQAQWQATWLRDPDGQRRRLILARVEDCDRPGLLAQLIGIDLFGLDADVARDRLRQAARAQRIKPGQPPGFPDHRRPPCPALPLS
ncbi:toll/interleukin-1 receptor domain-containing protein [Frankia sp. Ag45/Mut15]|uniref:Toll/interleukin-1 receptor domain-containing protein n=1 Tax=Frankia umida TaxID=573489 RepID=A0ABT0JYM3_9ACTN|nr:toll/interleukin-1 receptor domain-containing protein [Frankia umida]MCK9876643.1 toll/interleukin-1 receptor domain-containing protein [Frankia umida]